MFKLVMQEWKKQKKKNNESYHVRTLHEHSVVEPAYVLNNWRPKLRAMQQGCSDPSD